MDARGLIDFDDLVIGTVAALDADPQLRARWQARFSHVCVDEFQNVDAAQLRLVRILAAPEDNCLSLVMMISRSSQLAHIAFAMIGRTAPKEGSPLPRASDPTGTPDLRGLAFPGMRSAEARGHHGTCRQVR